MRQYFKEIQEKHPDLQPAYRVGEWGPNSKDFIDKICSEFKCKYPQEFYEFQLDYCTFTPMDDFAWDGFGWANPEFEPYMNLYEIVKDARLVEVPDYLAPFKIDNGDFYCFDTTTVPYRIVIWDHNSNMIEPDKNYQWNNFIDWIATSFR